MGAQIREYRSRIRSVTATKKITKAMELMASSRLGKARRRVEATTPYADAITKALAAVTRHSDVDHPLTRVVTNPRRAAVLVVTSDRGLAGAYSANVLKATERLVERLNQQGIEVSAFLYGRKAIQYFSFRSREFVNSWEGNTDAPVYETAVEISDTLLDGFLADSQPFDEVHVVYTRFNSMVSQEVRARRVLPLAVVDAEHEHEKMHSLFEFEPSADEVLDAVLPQYVRHRIYNCLLQAAASELANRQRAMKSATDNAEELIKTYTRLANQARQAEITQEITEIVGGADALADA
ncbi:F0F1 ATP synthase subunit gamma [Dermatophilus congolensis]|uniref:ATP synthase gamma chain n=1 Tax=Dermatophilus congolensis TaxID=1863 RepID=A0A239VDG3_9MICO|nr:F0F1 ATP synthase subunit gamma [Dermatophilus congolensis]MBO3128718.1 F0F1 ATP synthase subunit gamma [Dermatophilus congolensis]MBO3132645.1 F0F1 ATP synthase subunit gamma [Dermatophilus congolensis]MBO3133194.1 F0F1 ATP synthase subunit gamma [Dermatophilus congolensis]MBO3135429.1 F0F1 ATP synthase subunit gamma [Dermatophilus congolensis]MBO3137669.1 F0F1 ATP synthase subunit gamma [Dermatophilus congolensis]